MVPVRSCTQSPSPSPCLPSSSLGFVFPRVSDAPFGGRRDGPTPSRSAASSPPLTTDPGRSSARAPGSREHPMRPGVRTTTQPTRHNFAQPLCCPLLGAHPSLQRWVGSRSAPSPGGGGAQPQPHSYLRGAGRGEERGHRAPQPAPRRVCPCAAAAAAAAGWRAHWLAARLTPHRGFLWGWTKDISWEEQGNVPSMPRFVVPGDFLPPRSRASGGSSGPLRTRGRREALPPALSAPGEEAPGDAARPEPAAALARIRAPGEGFRPLTAVCG